MYLQQVPTLRVNRFVFQHGTPHVWRVDQTDPIRLELFNTYFTQPCLREPDEEFLASLHDMPRYDPLWISMGSLWIPRPNSSYSSPPYDIDAVYEVTDRSSQALPFQGPSMRVVFREHPLDGSETKLLSLNVFEFMCQAVRLYSSFEEVAFCPPLESLIKAQEQAPEEGEKYVYWVLGKKDSVPVQAAFHERSEAMAHARSQAEILGVPRRDIRVSKRLADTGPPPKVQLIRRSPPVPHRSRFSYLDEYDDVE